MPKLAAIQVLRILSAMAVAALHAQYDAAALSARFGGKFTPLETIPWAAGVDVFFVISGFVMVHASAKLFAEPGASTAFLSRRIARVVPIYWAATTLYLLIASVAPTLLNRELLQAWPIFASYLFIPFDRPDGLAQPVYSLGWTLNYEMAFYALFAGFVVLSRRIAVLGLIAMLSLLAGLGTVIQLPQPFRFWTDPIILEFALGLALGLARAEGIRVSWPWRGVLAVLAVALLAQDLTGSGMLPRWLGWGIPAALLVAAVSLGHSRRPQHAMWRFGVMLGDASYALYLVHPFVIRATREMVAQLGLFGMIGGWTYVVIVLVITTGVSILIHRGFERPATAWLRQRFDGASRLQAGGQAA
jgi:peptidoglycan/LPS O-acetylase OafA/YrhL